MSVNLKISGISGFNCLMYTNFIIRKKYSVETVAEKMGISKDSLYRWIRGNRLFPADRLSDLTNATEDFDYIDFILSECGLTAIPRIKDKSTLKMFTQMVKLMQSAIESSGKEE
ncbi:hypothetical protein ES707_00312 [subsurface metagenome]